MGNDGGMTGRRVEGRPEPTFVPVRLRPYWYRLFRVDDQPALGGFVCSLGVVVFGLVLVVIQPGWQAVAIIGGGAVAAIGFFLLPSVLDVLLERPARRPRGDKSAG